MAARHLQNTTMEVADSDVQDSAVAAGKNAQTISTVINNYNDNHMLAQIQDRLAGVLSTLDSVQSQNEKANEELDSKLIAESHKIADGLTEQLHHEITKGTESICQLREETVQTDTKK